MNLKPPLMVVFSIFSCCFFVAFIFFAKDAFAQIFQDVPISSPPVSVGSGARALGMGSAFISVSDDATAASWNPAGLVQLDRPEVSLVGTLFNFRNDIDPLMGSKTAAEGENININFLSSVVPFVLFERRFTFSLSYQNLYRFGNDVSLNIVNPQVKTHADIKTEGGLSAVSPSIAFDIASGVSFGAALNVWNSFFQENGWIENSSFNVTVGNDIFYEERKKEYNRLKGLSAVFGFLWELNDSTKLGAVFKTPVWLKGTHIRTSFETLNGVERDFLRKSEDIKLRLPPSVGVGASHRFSERFLLSLDYIRTFWSRSFLENDEGIRFNLVRGNPISYEKLTPTNHVRLGMEYILHNKSFTWPVCAGIGYDPEPKEGGVRNFYTVSIGSGLSFEDVSFDFSYELRFADSENTTYMGLSETKQLTLQHRFSFSVVQRF